MADGVTKKHLDSLWAQILEDGSIDASGDVLPTTEASREYLNIVYSILDGMSKEEVKRGIREGTFI